MCFGFGGKRSGCRNLPFEGHLIYIVVAASISLIITLWYASRYDVSEPMDYFWGHLLSFVLIIVALALAMSVLLPYACASYATVTFSTNTDGVTAQSTAVVDVRHCTRETVLLSFLMATTVLCFGCLSMNTTLALVQRAELREEQQYAMQRPISEREEIEREKQMGMPMPPSAMSRSSRPAAGPMAMPSCSSTASSSTAS